MSDFTSGFSAKIQEYLTFRNAPGFSDDHKKHLLRFDMYCSKFGKIGNILTKDIVIIVISQQDTRGREVGPFLLVPRPTFWGMLT